jgi:hypothetical protein
MIFLAPVPLVASARSKEPLVQNSDIGYFRQEVFAPALSFWCLAGSSKTPRTKRQMPCLVIGDHMRLNCSEAYGLISGVINPDDILCCDCIAKGGLGRIASKRPGLGGTAT